MKRLFLSKTFSSLFLPICLFLTFQSENVNAAASAEVVSYRAVIFSGPSKSSKPIGRVSKGRRLTVSSKAKNGFHKVRLKSKTAWVHESNIKIVGSVRKKRSRSKRSYNRDQQPHRQETGGSTRNGSSGSMSAISIGPTVHLIGDGNAMETIVGADVSNFWSYGGEYSFNLTDSIRVNFGLAIPFTQYSTENAFGNPSKTTLSGWMLHGSGGLIIANSKSMVATLGVRLGYTSITLKKEDENINPNPQEWSASGLMIYLPEVKGMFKFGESIGMEVMAGYRLSAIGDFSNSNTTTEVESKLGGLLISAAFVYWL